MEQQLNSIRETALKELAEAASKEALNELKVKYLGKKGVLTGVLRGLGALSPEERPRVGQIVNDIRNELEQIIADKLAGMKQTELARKLASETIDVTLPGRRELRGHLHPLTLTLNRIKDTFMRMGFEIAEVRK